MYFLLALSFLYIINYPYSPVLYNLYPYGAYYGFPFFTILIFFISLLKNKFVISFKFKEFIFINILFIFLITLSFLKTGNLTALRDILILISFLSISITFDLPSIYKLINKYGRILGIFLIFSIVVYFLMQIGVFNYINWDVEKLNLNQNSPIMIRNYNANDFDWYYVFGILVYPFTDSNTFQRLTLIFLEPTQLSYFLIPIFSIIYEDNFIKNKIFYISLFFLSICLALALSAHLSLFFGLTVLLLNQFLDKITNNTFTKKLFLYTYLLTSIIFIISALFNFPELTGSIIGLFSPEKKDQYEYLFQISSLVNDSINLSLFGENLSDLFEAPKTVGILIALFRYGYISIVLILITAFYTIRFSINILFDQYVPLITRNILSLSIISSFLLSFKSTNILFIQPLILIIYTISIREKYKEKVLG